ncbi:MAG TPA: type II secretion system protein [Longimicrobiales bacterium]
MNTRGFTLIEMMFVILIMALGCLALTQASAMAMHQAAVAGRQDERWATVQRWSDSLTVRGFDNVSAGADTIDGITGSWTVDSIAPDLQRITMGLSADASAGGWQDTVVLHVYR